MKRIVCFIKQVELMRFKDSICLISKVTGEILADFGWGYKPWFSLSGIKENLK